MSKYELTAVAKAAQEKYKKHLLEKIEGIENPYSDDVHLAAGQYDGLKRSAFNEAIQAVKEEMEK